MASSKPSVYVTDAAPDDPYASSDLPCVVYEPPCDLDGDDSSESTGLGAGGMDRYREQSDRDCSPLFALQLAAVDLADVGVLTEAEGLGWAEGSTGKVTATVCRHERSSR